MSASTPTASPPKAIPAQLGFLAIYNPSLGTTDETLENQIVYHSENHTQEAHDAGREKRNEQLRQIGLAQGMVEFGRSFSDGRAVDTVETEKSRIILHELEAGWWILASITLTVLPSTASNPSAKAKLSEQGDAIEYSSREVKPEILLLGDLLRAHSTFLLHHASSLSALFVRTRRSKFVSLLGRYWNTFLSTWNVLMHGNPANNLYGGIKIAACGELGMGVGEEERGSGEREVLEGFVGRVEGLVDVIVSKFGDGEAANAEISGESKGGLLDSRPSGRWLGSGNEPSADDGAVFLGTGALSRKSLRDVSHWIEDLYRWGPYAYGVTDNPSSNRQTKKTKQHDVAKPKELSTEAKENARQVYGLDPQPNKQSQGSDQNSVLASPPAPIYDARGTSERPKPTKRRPSLRRGPKSFTSSDSESNKSNKFIHYLKLGYGTHWSLGGSISGPETESPRETSDAVENTVTTSQKQLTEMSPTSPGKTNSISRHHRDDSIGHYLIGLMGDFQDADEIPSRGDADGAEDQPHEENGNARVLLRTLTVELEREEDARAETEISIDLGMNEEDRQSSKQTGSEHTGTSNTSFESQDRNKTKKLRVVVYAHKPFVFVFLFELRTDALALGTLYQSLHSQVVPLIKPLLSSTTFRALKPEIIVTEDSTTPIYDLVWDPKQLTVNSTIPNIPDPILMSHPTNESMVWSRVEALNTHMQIINTYLASSTDRSELERTCKTSRGWWIVWTRASDPEPVKPSLASRQVKIPSLITEDSIERQKSTLGVNLGTSRGTSTFGASMTSGPAHPFLESRENGFENFPKDKEIYLIRRASDYVASKSANRFTAGLSQNGSEGWTSGPGKLAQGIGLDTKRYIEGLLNLNR